MSLVVLVLFGIVLFNKVRGYQRGVLMVLYSIAAWVVILIAANGLAPRVKDFMVNHTQEFIIRLNNPVKKLSMTV